MTVSWNRVAVDPRMGSSGPSPCAADNPTVRPAVHLGSVPDELKPAFPDLPVNSKLEFHPVVLVAVPQFENDELKALASGARMPSGTAVASPLVEHLRAICGGA